MIEQVIATGPEGAVEVVYGDGRAPIFTSTKLPADTATREELQVWLNAGGVVASRPPLPTTEVTLEDISDRQFAQGLAELGLISEPEAEDWVAAGTLPPALATMVEKLPAERRFAARMLLRGATRFEFSHPLAEDFAQLADPPWSTEQRAAFWRHCATL